MPPDAASHDDRLRRTYLCVVEWANIATVALMVVAASVLVLAPLSMIKGYAETRVQYATGVIGLLCWVGMLLALNQMLLA